MRKFLYRKINIIRIHYYLVKNFINKLSSDFCKLLNFIKSIKIIPKEITREKAQSLPELINNFLSYLLYLNGNSK